MVLPETMEEAHAWAVARAKAEVDAAVSALRAARWCRDYERSSLSPRPHVLDSWEAKMADASVRIQASEARLKRVEAGDYRA